MNKNNQSNPGYQKAEQKARDYFQMLFKQVREQTYVPLLINDFNSWKHHHVHHSPFLSFFSSQKKKTAPRDYHPYIQWLNYTGKLEPYLERSIAYLFLRDLGKDLGEPETQNQVRRVASSLKTQLTTEKSGNQEPFNLVGLYRKSQEEGIESTMIWLIHKLKNVTTIIPEEMDGVQAQRKLIKIIAGVLMHVVNEIGDEVTACERKKRLDIAIRIGYCYGLTYPFIDDLLDSNVLTPQEKHRYSDLIRTTLTTRSVPSLGKWTGPNKNLVEKVHKELKEAFEYIKAHQRSEFLDSFFEQSYVFFHSQEVDRKKNVKNTSFTNEDLYLPVILKSASSRLIVRSVISAPEDKGFDDRTFYYGIYNQLADDFADLFDDLEDGAVTPYTYYWLYHDKRPDLINPFELYWSVIAHLIHHVYLSDTMTREVILDRAINGLKRYKAKMGNKKYKKVMDVFTANMQPFNGLIQQMVKKAEDVDFFDKLLRDQMITSLKQERNEREDFFENIKQVREQINSLLPITKTNEIPLLDETVVEAANYSLEGDGKRLRSVMACMMSVKEYGLNQASVEPLIKSIEYLHTASLIFDDLPSQDNSLTRRGRPALHQVYNVAIAELTGIFLTQKATAEQASLNQFDSKTVLELIRYSAQMTSEMCKGQAMDLASKGKTMTHKELNLLCFYKTGMAFEAALVMPAILAQAKADEIAALKKFAWHAGIAFQIQDDLLDVEGEEHLLGKPVGQDAENNRSTFVSILGIEEAKKGMWDHYCSAIEALQHGQRKPAFLKHVMDYIVHRDY